MGRISLRGDHPTSFAFGAHPRFTHEPGYAFTRASDPLLVQLSMNAWAPIPLSMRTKDLSNVGGQLSIFSTAPTGGARAPGIKAAFRNFQDSAHHHNGKLLLVLFNKLIFHLDSREKMLTTFFSISRSCWTLSNSRLSRRFSSSNAV